MSEKKLLARVLRYLLHGICNINQQAASAVFRSKMIS